MKRFLPELLAPAGGPEEFNAALFAGADAIYCGFGNTFNARRGAQNFSSNDFGEACRRAHIAGVRVYVTVNVAIRDDEMPSVLALVRRAWLLGADAFIIQDWGLLYEVHKRWPNIECHISTQANVHDARASRWCVSIGATRVTLSRELSLKEVERIAQTGVELECFCHGAICICYSGVCQMSSCAGDRSANRGSCAQPCRLPYELVDERGEVLSVPDRGRPLCPRDFYSFERLDRMIDVGVQSLKVEGRLKGPDYLVSVIGTYRRQLDDLAAGMRPNEEELANRKTSLKRAFNRDFTDAYLVGTSGDELMSYERSNNRGELVGEVVGSQLLGKTKVRRGGHGGGRERLRTVAIAQTDVELHRPIGEGDLLEIRPKEDPNQFLTTYAPGDAAANTIVSCTTKRVMAKGSPVRVIRSKAAMERGARAASLEIARKRKVCVAVRARLGEPFEVKLNTLDGMAGAGAKGFVVEAARTRAVTREDLVEHVGRMGNTPFEPVAFDIDLDEGCGMSFSAVHKVRAQACEALEQALLKPYALRELANAPSREAVRAELGLIRASTPLEDAVEICAVVTSVAMAHGVKDAGATRLYATTDALAGDGWPQGVVPLLDEVCRETDHARLDPWVRGGEPVAVGNVSELVLAHERGALPELRGCIPVHNASCLKALGDAGAKGVWLSAELSLAEIEAFAPVARIPVGMVVYGRTRAMTCEHCVLQVADACCKDCARCSLRARKTYLRGERRERYPVQTDLQGRSRVYAAKPLDTTPQIPQLIEAGVRRFAVDCTLLSVEESVAAVRRAVRAVWAYYNGCVPERRMPSHTSGHLLAPIL